MGTRVNRFEDIEMAIGHRIRQRRQAAGITQRAFGEQIGVTFQQFQKYELGTNRVAVSTMMAMASALGTTMPELLDGISADGK